MRLINADSFENDLCAIDIRDDTFESVDLEEALRAARIFWNVLKSQPIIDWTRCEENLPDSYTVICCDEYENIMIGHVFEDEDSPTGYSAENDVTLMDSVVAWLPLPEPYKVGSKAYKNVFNALPEEKGI